MDEYRNKLSYHDELKKKKKIVPAYFLGKKQICTIVWQYLQTFKVNISLVL